MQVHIVSLFPEYFRGPFDCGPTRVAQEKGLLSIDFVNPRDFTSDRHRTVDDYPFGGGPGMILKPEPLFRAVESVKSSKSRILLLSPQGVRFNQSWALEFSRQSHLVLICGRYKGVDERVRTVLADLEVSVGDYILAGGEAAAIVIVESVSRLLPGAVGHEDSVTSDSFSTGLLDAPYWTRPRRFRGHAVPEVLVSGNHAQVAQWRREQALLATARCRPELLRNEVLSEAERELLLSELGKEQPNGEKGTNT